MIEEIIHKLKELKGLLVEITDTVYSNHTRHELGGPDQINIDASQVVSGVFDLARIPDLPRGKITDFFSSPFWENIPDKPTTYPPEPHTHVRSEITDFFSVPFWENIPDKPSTYPPSPHTHVRSDITDFWNAPFWENIPDKPTAYPPEAHTHVRSDITDLFASPFWDNIPDKPFNTLSTEFTVVSGVLQIASVDWSKIANKPSEYPPEAHTHTRSEITDFWSTPFWDNIPDKPSTFPPEAHTHPRSDITDFFSSSFWDNIPDKPFSTLGSEFTTSDGELQVASIDFSKITNRLSSLITFDSSLVPNTDYWYDLGNESYRWRDIHAKKGYFYDVLVCGIDKDIADNFVIKRPAGDAGYSVGFNMQLYDSAGNWTPYGAMYVKIVDPTDGAETGKIRFHTRIGGSWGARCEIDESGNFVPASDGNYDLGNESYRWRDGWFSRNVYVDGNLGIGTTSPEKLVHIYGGWESQLLIESSADHPAIYLRGYDGSSKYTIRLAGAWHGRAVEWYQPKSGYYFAFVAPKATSDNQIQNSWNLQFKCMYWDGSASKDFTFKIIPEVLDTTPTGRLRFNLPGVGDILVLHSSEGVQVGDNLRPMSDNAYDLGDENYKWRNLWLGGSAYIDGSVGIGTNSPARKLHVYGYGVDNPIVLLGNDDTDLTTGYGMRLSVDMDAGVAYIDVHTQESTSSLNHRLIFRGGHGSSETGHERMLMWLDTSDGSLHSRTHYPLADNVYDLGDSSCYWRNIYYKGTLYGGSAEFSGDVKPSSDNAFDLGSIIQMWRGGYIASLYVSRFLDYVDEFVSEDDVGITAFVSMSGGTTYVVAFEDNTVVHVNGKFQGVINAGERLSLSLNAGDVVSANKPIMVHSNSERHVPITWKSTKFVIPFYRNDNQIICIYAPDADANVNIYIGNATDPTTTVTVTKGTATSVSLAVSPPKAVILESDSSILVAVASNNGSYDIRFIHPPERELIGIPSTYFYVSALEDNTTIVWYQGDNSGSYTLNRGDIVVHSTLGVSTGSHYDAIPVRVIADKPIMISSFADGDGTDATCGLPIRVLPTKMVLPVSAQWLSIAVPYPDTTIRIYYQGVLKYEATVTNTYSSLLAPACLYLRPSDIDNSWSSIPYGTVIEADKPVYVVFDCAEVWTDDETVLLGINSRKWRIYKNLSMALSADLVPPQDNVFDLGGVNLRWRKIYVCGARVQGVGDTYFDVYSADDSGWDAQIRFFSSTGSLRHLIYDRWSDNRLYIHTGYGGGAVQELAIVGAVLPSSDNTYDFGGLTSRWRNGHFAGTVYANEFVGNSHLIIYPL